MKMKLYPFAIACFMISCGDSASEETTEGAANETVEVVNEGTEADLLASTTMDPRTFGGDKNENQAVIDSYNLTNDQTEGKFLGSYVGEFGKNMINITIAELEGDKAKGYSVCAGNFRPLDGFYEDNGDGTLKFTLEEPGDDKYDGKFEFELSPVQWVVSGTWVPFVKEGNSSKEYFLNKRIYKYDNTVGKYPEASQRELTDDDLNNLLEEDLTEMRNEIYARHGYSFKNKDWRYHFEALDWYMPMGVDIREKLTDIEVVNIELIYEYESYFQDYYDDYGR